MNNKEFIAALAARTGRPAAETQQLADHVAHIIGSQLEGGEPLQVEGFGTFEVKKRMEREMVSPTGQRMLVPPKLVVGFRPSQGLKESVQKGGAE